MEKLGHFTPPHWLRREQPGMQVIGLGSKPCAALEAGWKVHPVSHKNWKSFVNAAYKLGDAKMTVLGK
jgi:hypothetical protein